MKESKLMDIAAYQKRAAEIRKLYADMQESKTGDTWSRQEIMEGFVGDIGQLMKIIMAKEGRRGLDGDIDEQLKHELMDCLWSVLVLIHEYNIDLEKTFFENMDQLEDRIKRLEG